MLKPIRNGVGGGRAQPTPHLPAGGCIRLPLSILLEGFTGPPTEGQGSRAGLGHLSCGDLLPLEEYPDLNTASVRALPVTPSGVPEVFG